nr:MAG TPA: Repressor protein CI [Caudoviricetes sp.]
MNTTKDIFSKNLQYYMELHELNNKELSEILGVSESTVGKWLLRKSTPRMGVIEKLARYFNIQKSDLIEQKEPELTFVDLSNYIKIPVVGKIPAGVPIEAIEDIIETIDIPEDWTKGNKEYIGLRVSGDSMYPVLLDGDTVVIQVQPSAETGDICACYVNGYDATLKRIALTPDSITLKPENPNYPPKTYTHPGEVTIAGKVVEVRRKL